ncbi:MAG: class I SAM-dependent methyltransferase [Actinomycetota bacterium]
MSRPMPAEPLAPDGSPVELYAQMPSLGEAELIHSLVPQESEILELGCGAGRITHELVALGHPVVAVDQSPEMLARVRGAETILADIESLDLGRVFPAVVLASNLINTPDPEQRRAVLLACRRHVGPGGVVVIERLDPDSSAWKEGSVRRGPLAVTLRGVVRDGDLISADVDYELDERRWTHSFTARLLDDRHTEDALRDVGLRLEGWVGRRWLRATRSSQPNRCSAHFERRTGRAS